MTHFISVGKSFNSLWIKFSFVVNPWSFVHFIVRVSAEEFSQILSLEYVELVNGLSVTPLILKVHNTFWALKVKTSYQADKKLFLDSHITAFKNNTNFILSRDMSTWP